MRPAISIFLLFFLAQLAFSQAVKEPVRIWKLSSVDGLVRGEAMYRQKYVSVGENADTQESMYFSGGLRLNTDSYFWHPNFLKVKLGVEFFPETGQDEYVVSPDRAEVRTLKGLNLGTVLFDNRPLTLSSWLNLSETFQNRENLTNIKSRTRRMGSTLYFRNRILPLSLSYQDMEWDQQEIETGRVYQTEQEQLEFKANKSFSSLDQNELSYSHNRYYRKNDILYDLENFNDILRLSNRIFLDKNKKSAFRSYIQDHHRRGSETFHVFTLRESLRTEHARGFRSHVNYNFYWKDEVQQYLRQHKAELGLEHELYQSLLTDVDYAYTNTSHSFYQETRHTISPGVDYKKKIPGGSMHLYYRYILLLDDMDAESRVLDITREAYVLTDGEITMLNRPYIDPGSVRVTDASGTIVYQEDFDYLLIEQGDYLEIQRVPGGLIPNGFTVYLDYTALQTGSYSYNSHTHSVGARLVLFRRFVEVYYRGRYVDYKQVEKSDLLVLNYLEQNVYGMLLRLWFAEFGFEYEEHQSTINPYDLRRYYANIQKRFGKMLFSLNGNHRDYYMLDDELRRIYSDLTARWGLDLSSRTRISLMAGYRKQQGTGIDLDLLTSTLEFRTRFRKLYLSTGLDVYLRDYVGENINYYGGYVKLERKF